MTRDDVLRKLRALRAKTPANGCTEAEAAAAASIAARILDDYQLSLAEVEASDDPFDTQTFRDRYKYADSVMWVGAAIGEFCDVCVYISHTGKGGKERLHTTIFGRKADVEVALYILTIFARAFSHEWHRYCGCNLGRRLSKRHRADFAQGMSVRFRDKLVEMKAKRNARHSANGKTTGQDLALAKAQEVRREMDIRGMNVRAEYPDCIMCGSAYREGQKAGAALDIVDGVHEEAKGYRVNKPALKLASE